MRLSLITKKGYHVKEMMLIPVFGRKGIPVPASLSPDLSGLMKRRGFKGETGDRMFWNSGEYDCLFLGAGSSLKGDGVRKLAKTIYSAVHEFKLKRSLVDMSEVEKGDDQWIASFLDYLLLNSYSFHRYLTSNPPFKPASMILLTGKKERINPILQERIRVAEVVNQTRDLINEIPAVVTPEYMKNMALRLEERAGLQIDVFDEKRLEKENLRGLLNVGAGSPHRPCMVKLTYSPPEFQREIAIIGKGITYDSGGLNIKPGKYMSNMKSDMAGSAVALGITDLVSRLKLPVKTIAFLPLAENMPSERSFKPDDIISFRNGKTVEILNTDAEGRLVLADAIIMAAEEKPDLIIEISTLTGSIVTALGHSLAGIFTQSGKYSRLLKNSGNATGEYLWEMPLYQNYISGIQSKIADLKNAGYGDASSIKAGLFLNEFSGKVPFVHLDIAGTAFIEKESEYINGTGATGFGVRLLADFLKSISID